MTGPGVPPDLRARKVAWRRWARALPPPEPTVVDDVAAALAVFLTGVDGIVLGYSALGDEVDIAGVLSSRSPGSVALPRLAADGSMTLHLDVGDREAHAFGVVQPSASAPLVGPADVAAALVPGRVFDRRGFRLGRGGGHYDRLLALLPVGVPVIGVAAAARVVGAVPTEAHDRPMTHLATEHGVVAVGTREST